MNDALLKKAESGDRATMYELALAYTSKAESESDEDKKQSFFVDAFGWMEKAAELDHDEAQFEMAVICKFGEDYERASYWLHKSADNGNVKAREALEVLENNTVENKLSKKRVAGKQLKRLVLKRNLIIIGAVIGLIISIIVGIQESLSVLGFIIGMWVGIGIGGSILVVFSDMGRGLLDGFSHSRNEGEGIGGSIIGALVWAIGSGLITLVLYGIAGPIAVAYRLIVVQTEILTEETNE